MSDRWNCPELNEADRLVRQVIDRMQSVDEAQAKQLAAEIEHFAYAVSVWLDDPVVALSRPLDVPPAGPATRMATYTLVDQVGHWDWEIGDAKVFLSLLESRFPQLKYFHVSTGIDPEGVYVHIQDHEDEDRCHLRTTWTFIRRYQGATRGWCRISEVGSTSSEFAAKHDLDHLPSWFVCAEDAAEVAAEMLRCVYRFLQEKQTDESGCEIDRCDD